MGFFLSFIPKKVKNKTVVNVLDRMRHIGCRMHIAWKYAASQAESRNARIREMIREAENARNDGSSSVARFSKSLREGYIEDQHNLGSIHYGRSDMAYAGCEVIAVYNALIAMGEKPELGELIEYFERDGMVLSGRFGTAPRAIADYFTKEGFAVEETLDPESFDEIADRSDVAIVMFYNDQRSILSKVHTICITRETQDPASETAHAAYIAHNVYGNGFTVGPFESVSELMGRINGGYSKGIVLFGISKPHN